MRAWLLGVLLLALPASGNPPAALVVDAGVQRSADLKALEEDYWAFSLKAGPEQAFSLGVDKPGEPVLVDLSASSRVKMKAELTGLLKRLLALRVHISLFSSEERVDLKLLELMIRGDLHRLEASKDYQTSLMSYALGPVFYINGRQAVFTGAGTKEEWIELARVLEALPKYYAQAKDNVREGLRAGRKPYKRYIERFLLKQCEDGAKLYEEGLAKAALAALGDTAESKRVKDAGAAAAKAARSFAAFLKDEVVPAASDDIALGKEETDYRLQAELGPGMDADRVAKRLEAHKKELQSRLDALTEELSKELGVPKEEVYARVTVLPKDDAEVLKLYRDAATRAEAFIRKNKILDLPAGYKVDIRPAPDATADLGAYYSSPPVFKGSAPGTFFVAASKGDKKKLSEHSVAEIPATAVHEALPGHDAQFQSFRAGRDVLPRFRWLADSRANLEGWAMYATDLMRRAGFFSKAEEYLYLLTEKGATEGAVQEILLHTGKMTIEKLAEDLASSSKSSKDAILDGLYRTYAMPLYDVNYIMGQLQIEDLKADYKAKKGKAYSEADFHKELLKAGPIPVWLVRESLLPSPTWLDDLTVKAEERMRQRLLESVEDL